MEENDTMTTAPIYIGVMQAEGIGEIELAPAEAADLPKYVHHIADFPPLEITLTAEQSAAFAPLIVKAAEQAARKLRELSHYVTEVTIKLLREGTTMSEAARNGFVDAMLYKANDNPLWWHLYKHAKKVRIRRKYRNLLMRQLLSKMNAAAAVM